MASKTKFVSDFRSAVSTMIDAWSQAAALVAFHQTMGWSPGDFDALFAQDSEVTGADFDAALASVGGLATTFGSEASVLAKMKA